MSNPYQPPEGRSRTAPCTTPPSRFPFLVVGPIAGMSVGIMFVAATVLPWRLHGSPDFLIRSSETLFIFMAGMTIGGLLFGILYAGVVGAICWLRGTNVRPQLHLWVVTTASFTITYVASEYSLQHRQLVSPGVVLISIVTIGFLTVILSASKPTGKY
jgi:hypothetical protein